MAPRIAGVVTPRLRALLPTIEVVALDVDGVLTDDTFFWGPNGEEWKRFAFADVMGVSRATKAGLKFALVSGEASPLVDRYAQKMAIADVFKGTRDKAASVRELAARRGIDARAIAFIGNDVNDLGAMELCGVSACPADAHPAVLAHVDYVATHVGGHGAVREVLDLFMTSRDAARAVAQASLAQAPLAQAPDRSEMNGFFQRELEDHQRVLAALVADHTPMLEQLASTFVDVFRRGNKLLFCGNGGSAADCQHIVAEFINRFRFDRGALPAIALTVDTSVLTCIGNDSAFERIFSRQVEALAQPGDAVIGITTSGRSANVLRALEAARSKGAMAIGFTGAAGPAHMGALCDLCLAVPSTDTARIQEAHEFAFHCIAALAERAMFTPADPSCP